MTESPPGPPGSPAVGPLAVEAALLLDVVAERLASLRRTAPEAAGADPADRSPGAQDDFPPGKATSDSDPRGAQPDGRCPECGSTPGAYCTACPLCRFLALLRGERPEATAKLVDGALLIVRTLRSLVPDPAPPPGPTAATHDRTAGDPPPARRGGLEHIDIL